MHPTHPSTSTFQPFLEITRPGCRQRLLVHSHQWVEEIPTLLVQSPIQVEGELWPMSPVCRSTEARISLKLLGIWLYALWNVKVMRLARISAASSTNPDMELLRSKAAPLYHQCSFSCIYILINILFVAFSTNICNVQLPLFSDELKSCLRDRQESDQRRRQCLY